MSRPETRAELSVLDTLYTDVFGRVFQKRRAPKIQKSKYRTGGNPTVTETTTLTGAGGYYRFDNASAGETYVISAKGKHFEFAQSMQVVDATEDVVNINFVVND